MENKFIFRLLSLLLALVLLTGALFGCFSVPGANGTSASTNVGGLSTTKPTVTTADITGTTKPPVSTSTTTKPTTSTTTSGEGGNVPDGEHIDSNDDGWCDVDGCGIYVIETIDFYNFNDLHGKFENMDDNEGVDELTTYLENRKNIDDHVVILSTGDMWQGGTASNGTHGRIVTDWMNYLGFEAMALGNHEFDWGQDAIRENVEMAEFPILAINIYDNATGKRVDYCQPSAMIERGGAQIGIIGAIGDCYSSISSDKTNGINFKVGSALTSLVKEESVRLREAGADAIIYLIHDGTTYSSLNISDYYDISLSSGGYVDLVFGGHTHSYYIIKEDAYGVPHLQGGGDNTKGITHVELNVNFANGNTKLNVADYVDINSVKNLEDAPIVQELLDKYWDEIGWMYGTLGYNASNRNSTTIANTVAKLYYEAGVERWGDRYNIVLAGGSLNVRSPYYIYKGDVQYGDLQTVLPFDNAIYLCRIRGTYLKSRFLNNSDYAKYSTITASQVKDNEYYYIVADSWTALYYWAQCEAVEIYDETTYARDLLAKYIQNGGWD